MGLLRRLGGAVVLLLSAAGISCCAAAVIGTWMFYHRVAEKVQTISARLDDGLQRVSAANQNVRSAVAKARGDVANVGQESADLGGGGEKNRRAARALRALIQEQAGPNIDELGGRLATLSDASVAVSSLLQSFQELPSGRSLRVEPDQLKRRAEEAQQLSATLRRLGTAVGDGDKEASSREVAAVTSQVDLVLQRCLLAVDDWQSDLDAAREDLARVKGQILGWLRCAAVAVTVLCLWVGAGQVSLFAHALKWCRGT
jgi:hypothetical protein